VGYDQGQWKVDCDNCGFPFKSGELRKMWNNTYACFRCWESRQPQDLLRANKKDGKPPPWTRGLPFKTTESNIVFPLSAQDNLITVEDSSVFPNSFPFDCNIVGDLSEEMVTVLDSVDTNTFLVVRGIVDIPKDFP
jgi:hypothetical protein